ncbi:MAG: hypothetical protein HWD62_15950 [Cyclobacteriaceae bacterium]|nr:MAG: hypothetical protein HWD62_15950 [Cyclobacteriaceae bacterium]
MKKPKKAGKSSTKTRQKPNINPSLLWEYDLDTFNYDKSYKIVIERVLERGHLNEWREILKYYGEEKS